MYISNICENDGGGAAAAITVIGHVSDAIRHLFLYATEEKKKNTTASRAAEASSTTSADDEKNLLSRRMLLRAYLNAASSSGPSAASSVPVPAFTLGAKDAREIVHECKSITSAIADEVTTNEGIVDNVNTILALQAWFCVKRDIVAEFVRESASENNLGDEDMMQFELFLIYDLSFTRRIVLHALPWLDEQADTRSQGRAIVHAERLWSDAYACEIHRAWNVGGQEQYEWCLWAQLRALIRKGKTICGRWKRYVKYDICPEEDEVWKNLAHICSERLQMTMHALKFVRSKTSTSALSISSRSCANAYDLHALAQKLRDDDQTAVTTKDDCMSPRQAKLEQMYRCALDVVNQLTSQQHDKEDEEKSPLALMGIDLMDVLFLS